MKFLCIECEKSLEENSFFKKVENKCKVCLNKKLKWQICGKYFTKKWLTIRMEREHHQNKSKPNVLEKSKNDNEKNNNNRTHLVGPNFSGKTYLMLKISSRVPNQIVFMITKAPPEQYSNSKIKIKEIGEVIKSLNE